MTGSLQSPRLAVFCDFDGTFSVEDVGSTLGRTHLAERREALWKRLEAGELDPWGYNLALLEGFEFPEVELERFLATIQLDPGARDLVAWCDGRGIPFRVLSDGFDWNLDRLKRQNRIDFDYDANHLEYRGGRWHIQPGFPNAACGCGTGVCKRARIEAFAAAHPGVRSVHIGNGRVSDLCAALCADHTFAKDTLAEELSRRGVPFSAFRTLHDVISGLEQLTAPRSAGAARE